MHGHRAVCGGDLGVGDVLDNLIIELEVVVEVVQSRVKTRYRWGRRRRPRNSACEQRDHRERQRTLAN